MAIIWELNRCACCGVQLPPDDFDGICASCDTEEHEKKTQEEGHCILFSKNRAKED